MHILPHEEWYASMPLSSTEGERLYLQVRLCCQQLETTDLPTQPIAYDECWKHLTGLQLADPNFEKPGHIDILLGADTFSQSVCHGRQYGPVGSPTAFSTCFSWVLAGSVCGNHWQNEEGTCFVSTTACDSLLKTCLKVENYSFPEPLCLLKKGL